MKRPRLTRVIPLLIVGTAAVLLVPTVRKNVAELAHFSGFSASFLRAAGPDEEQPASHWIEGLKSADDEERRKAAYMLCSMGDEPVEAVPALSEALHDPTPLVRVNAALAIYKLSNRARPPLPVLIEALHDDVQLVRLDALLTMRKFGEEAKPAIPALVSAIQAKENRVRVPFFEKSVREAAVATLGGVGPTGEEALPVLYESLDDSDHVMRVEAAKAICQISPNPKKALSVLVDGLKNGSYDVQVCSALCLADLGSRARDAVPDLKALLKDKSNIVRQLAARALQEINPQLAAQPGGR